MERERVKIDDFAKIVSLSEVCVSPDGQAVAFVVSQPDVEENCYKASIWIYEKEQVRKLTAGDSDTGILWLDGEHLLFPGDRKKSHKPQPGKTVTVYNRICIHGGEAEELFTVPMKCKSIRKIGAKEYLLTAVCDYGQISLEGLEGKEREAAIARIEENKDYEVFDELPFWSNGTGVVNKKRTGLYLFSQESGDMTRLSPKWMNVAGFDYREEDDLVLYYGSDYQWMDERKSDLYVREVHGEKQVQINLERKFGVSAALWAGDQIYFAASDNARYGTAENPCQFVADPVSGAWRKAGDLDCNMGSSVGSDVRHGGGKTMKIIEGDWYFTSTRGFDSVIERMKPDGTSEIISPKVHGSIDCWDDSGGTFYYVAMREGGLQELYRFTPKEAETMDGTGQRDLCDSGYEERLTGFHDSYLTSHSVLPLKPLCFVDRDGVEIDGWVMEPVDYDEEKTYPAILDVHGGPKTVYGEVFFHEMQFWANEGYFVFFCNPRGGDGKGNVFADIAGKHYGVRDYNDLMEFTDRVLEAYPQIDRARVGMTGGSYGGFMANWIVGHTDRFAAVASQRSISNFISKCLTTDIGYYHNLSAMQCDPWSDPEEMWNRSPLKYADKCVTPTLFIQSDEDYRCWMGDAVQMFTALRMHGCPTRMCLFHGENHELSRNGKPKHRIRRLKEITDWFDTYLK